MSTQQSSRRGFIKTATASAGALAFGSTIPSSVLGANDRINWGVIGTGGMGTGHLELLVDQDRQKKGNFGVGAVCDVYRRRLTKAQQMSGGEGYMDYRELLDRKDIDVVLIATPDHWHSTISIDALEAGKNVYCEKPMTLTAEQAVEVRKVVKKTKKAFQVGPNQTANPLYRNVNKMIKDGKLGKVSWAQSSYNRNVRGCGFNEWFLIDPTAGPHQSGEDYIDWDMWLGHKLGLAPRIPWNPEHYFRFRKYWPYNGGVATDLLYHRLAPLLVAMVGNKGEYPWRVNASGGLYIEKDGREIPDVFMMNIDYKSEMTIHLVSVLTNNTQVPTKIYGKYGTLDLGHEASAAIVTGNGDFVPEFKAQNQDKEEFTVNVPRLENPYIALEDNLMDVMRNGGSLFCDEDLGTATMVAIKMGVESYRQSKTLIWDNKSEKIASL